MGPIGRLTAERCAEMAVIVDWVEAAPPERAAESFLRTGVAFFVARAVAVGAAAFLAFTAGVREDFASASRLTGFAGCAFFLDTATGFLLFVL
jgi:hypothetical protein